jgi:hypothetical protein
MSKKIITQDELKTILKYDEKTGLFYKKDKITGNVGKDGYAYIYLYGKFKLAHRIAFLYIHGYLPEYIDHINGIKDDNRICNLRECTSSENNCNSRISSLNSSGTRGVSFDKKSNRYRVQIYKNKKRFNLGYFSNIEDAKIVANKARIELHKDFYR